MCNICVTVLLFPNVYILEDIPSDAEAEARLHQSEQAQEPPEEDEKSESPRVSPTIGTCH